MKLRTALVAAGAGLTTFLLAAVLVIELLPYEFSAIVGLPVGLLAGLGVVVGLLLIHDELTPGVRRAVSGYATFGPVVLVLFALRYVNVGRSVLSTDVVTGLAVGATVLVYLGLSLRGREPQSNPTG